MILLEPHCAVTFSTLVDIAKSADGGIFKAETLKYCDFDGVKFSLVVPADLKDNKASPISLTITLSYAKDLTNLEAHLKTVYGKNLASVGGQQTVMLKFTLEELCHDIDKDVPPFIMKLSLLKMHCFASLFVKYFEFQQAEEKLYEAAKKKQEQYKPKSIGQAVINTRPGKESIYVNAKYDRVTIVFSVRFTDPDDVTIGRIFMQEFMEGRKLRNQQAPQVLFSHRTPPNELEDAKKAVIGDDMFYVTFVLMGRHTSPKSAENTVSLIYQFRNYFHYHIKCSKAYMHQKMRAQTAEFIKVINRAKPDQAPTERKAIDGRTLVAHQKQVQQVRKIVQL